MSNTRTAETPALDQPKRWASDPAIAGPRLGQTILATATRLRGPEQQEILRRIGGTAIAEGRPLEELAEEANLDVRELRQALCDPSFDVTKVIGSLRKLAERKVREVEQEPFVRTRISDLIEDVLDQAAGERMLAIINGDYRTGKSYVARRWVRMNLHRAVYIEVPAGGDKNIFLRTLGQAFGIGVSSTFKNSQIEWRIRQACREWKPLVVLDEAHRLWNEDAKQTPQRIELVRDLVSPAIGASVVCISTNQFANAQERAERGSKTWGSGQWVGRIGRYEELPSRLEDSEIKKIAEAHFPQASEEALQAVVDFAVVADGLLGSIENVAKMARHLAKKDGKDEASSTYIKRAIKALIPTSRVLREQMQKGVA